MSDLHHSIPAAGGSGDHAAFTVDGGGALSGQEGSSMPGIDDDDAFFASLSDGIILGGAGGDSFAGDAAVMADGPGSGFMIYDASDALLCGGEGIDVLLTAGDEVLTGLLDSGKVADVEVLLRGGGVSELISAAADTGADGEASSGMSLADFGITLSGASDAATMSLAMAETDGAGSYVSGSGWVRESDTSFAHYDGGSSQSDLHMDIAGGAFLDPVNEAGQLIFQLSTGNG